MDALLAERYVPLARKLAYQAVRRYRLQFDEVYSDALFGLTKAASRHRPDAPFTAYATAFIAGEIRHGIRARMGFRTFRERGETPPRVVSLDVPPFADDPEPLWAHLPDSSDTVRAVDRAELWRAVDGLPDSERIAVRGYYQLELSQDEIAAARGVNQMAVSRALKRARKRLSHRLAA